MHEHAGIAILIGLFFTVMLSEDSAIVSGTLLSLNGVVPGWQAFLACFLGMWSSDFTIYLLVKTGGVRALDSRWGRALVSREKVDKASGWFSRFGGFALVFSRLVLGTRTALLVVSGLMRYPTKRFLAVTMIGALGWLLIVFTLFTVFGPPFIAVFGLRWIIALVVFVSGGGATAFMVFRKKKERAAQAGGEPLWRVRSSTSQNS
ncbi:MAG TPA: DedA family protein [Chthoniobacterales bacterium]|jgi:membrane protein DedA with SNARE-associated domain|nr:DedA family protein [Chthoniobacterales bacterium]